MRFFFKATPSRRLLNIAANVSNSQLIGQPLYISHPHLLKSNEILPNHYANEFRERRMEIMSRLPDNSLLVILSYGTKYGSQNIFYPFQQNNNLLYLTGFNEPESCLAIEKQDGNINSRMFVKENDMHSLLWSGPTTGSEKTVQFFGVDSAHSIDELSSFIRDSINSKKTVYHDIDENTRVASPILSSLSDNGQSATQILQEFRVIKRQAEVAVIKDACMKSAEAFKSTMKFSRSTRFEAHLAAKMEYECRLNGAEGLAYVPVVAGGSRANILHYTRNNMMVSDGEMVLMDAGGKYNGYCTDISRTWPVNGKFSPPQKELYEAVLRVQEACIQVCKLDQSYQVSLLALNHLSMELMAEELGKLGFSNPRKVVHKLYPHSIGHYLGLDLHDCPKARQDILLQPGTVLTVEPGLYIPEDPSYPERFHGIGIRIEDDVVIETQENGGCTVMTSNAPKQAKKMLRNRG